jgi:hypothetical protein
MFVRVDDLEGVPKKGKKVKPRGSDFASAACEDVAVVACCRPVAKGRLGPIVEGVALRRTTRRRVT